MIENIKTEDTTNTQQIVYMVSNKVGMVLFKSKENANHFLSSFPMSVSGGMFITPILVFD